MPERDEKLTELALSLLVLTARDRVSPVAFEGDSRTSAELPKYEVLSPRYVGGTTVPDPDVSSVGMAEIVSVSSVVTWVSEVKEWKVDCSPLVLAPDEKKASSDSEVENSEPAVRAREPPRPALGGGVTIISRRSVGPLDTVTGEPPPTMVPASPRPKPNPGRASLARRRADSNSSPRSVIDVVRRSELLRLGAITRGSPG